MSFLGLFGGNSSSSSSTNQPIANIGNGSDGSGLLPSLLNPSQSTPSNTNAPPINLSIASSGSGAVTPSVNVVPTSNISANDALGPILSNVNTGGALILNQTDQGVVKSAFDFADDALNSASTSNYNSLQFAGAVLGNYATQTASNEQDILAAINQSSTLQAQQAQGVIGGLGNLTTSLVSKLSDAQTATLAFFGQQTQQLQDATTNAIGVASAGDQASVVNGLNTLQGTFIKVAIGVGVVVVAMAYILRKH